MKDVVILAPKQMTNQWLKDSINRQPLQVPPSLFVPGERQKATGVAYWFTQ